MTRGLGELQKKQILETHYKILRQLHKRCQLNKRPLRTGVRGYSYETLWKLTRNHRNTRIHRNILRRRLDELVSNGVIRKTYRRPHKRLSKHYHYLYSVYIDQRLRTSKAMIKRVYYPHLTRS